MLNEYLFPIGGYVKYRLCIRKENSGVDLYSKQIIESPNLKRLEATQGIWIGLSLIGLLGLINNLFK